MKQNCHAFMKDLNSKNIEKIVKWFETDSTVWIPPAGPVKTQRKIGVYFRAIFQKYKDLNWEVLEVFDVTESRFFIISKSKGIFRNDASYVNHLVTDIRFDDNEKIIFLSDFFKDTSCFKTNIA